MSHTPVVASTAANSRYTWDDFVALDEDDLRELIDGELVEVEVPTDSHEYIVGRLVTALTNWADAGHGGRALVSGYKVRISDRRGVMPDVQFFRAGNDASKRQQKGLVEGRPDLVVEVMSPSSIRYDRLKKLQWYAQLGVPEYWLVNPEAQMLERLVLREGVYAIVESLAGDDAFRPASFDGLEIPLARLWEA
ncbi:MAG TPA: Uma2 family endonuclease [Candidatus Acidoferrales bacterium]|nr:Uma2 family endonuclease [Candidatus Acidoferrales bacterium]